MYQNKKNLVNEIAGERIRILFSLAADAMAIDRDLAKKYVKSMRYISSHYKVQLPKKIKNGICRHCDEVLVPGINATTRIASSKGYIVTKCNKCGKEVHVHY